MTLSEKIGRISSKIADASGHPYGQILAIILFGGWMYVGFAPSLLTNVMSLAAFSLAQMLLYAGRTRELAVQAKLDEIISCMDNARDDLMHSEERTEREILELRK